MQNVSSVPTLPTDTDYYIFSCYPDEDSAKLTERPDLPPFYDNWMTGARIDIEIPQPLEYKIDEEDEGVFRPYFMGAVPLMSNDLIKVLTECGVNNLDTYEAIILMNRTGEIIQNYKAVNIIGLVKAADMTQSEYETSVLDDNPLIDVWFDKLILNESVIQSLGFLFFRMAEKVSVILVHKRIKERLEKHFPQLRFTHPAEFAG